MTGIYIDRPHVPHGPAGIPQLVADADYLAEAARHISDGYSVGGSNVTATVVALLHDVARALREQHEASIGFAPVTPLLAFARQAKTYVPTENPRGRVFSPRVRELHALLMETWAIKDSNSGPSRYPTSYVETFLDMALAVDEHLADERAAIRAEAAEAIHAFRSRVEEAFALDGGDITVVSRIEQDILDGASPKPLSQRISDVLGTRDWVIVRHEVGVPHGGEAEEGLVDSGDLDRLEARA